jgi:hypothetical protein
MINRIPFCFGNLMVRRKKIHKGCRIREKMQKKVKLPTVLTETALVSN